MDVSVLGIHSCTIQPVREWLVTSISSIFLEIMDARAFSPIGFKGQGLVSAFFVFTLIQFVPEWLLVWSSVLLVMIRR